MAKVTHKGTARHVEAENRAAARALRKATTLDSAPGDLETMAAGRTLDSFVNFMQKMGVGADNALSTAGYGFNPITRVRTMLEWIYRGSWLGGVAVDVVAEDMTRAGAEITGQMDAPDIAKIETAMTKLNVWPATADAIKWARLYGGGLAYMMIDGQDPATPLRTETIGRDQFKGLLALDRWMLEPFNELVTDLGPNLGKPKGYIVRSDSPALRNAKVHHSRVLRFVGIEMPYWQSVMEQLWGISVIERFFDRMVAFDSATTGAAQLVYKAYIRTYKMKSLREIAAKGGPALRGLIAYVELMRKFQGMEGITLLDGNDEMETQPAPSFSGLSDALINFGQQLAGALQIPLVRLFGQSPAGMNATGESDMRMYYDNIKQRQERDLLVPMTTVYEVQARSCGIRPPKDDFGIRMKPLWQMTPKERSEIAESIGRAVGAAEEQGLISQKSAMKELKQSSKETGIFSNITDDEIEAAEETLPPAGEEAVNMELEQQTALEGERGEQTRKTQAQGAKHAERAAEQAHEREQKAQKEAAQREKKQPGTRDSAIESALAVKRHHDLDVVIETEKGARRSGGTEPYQWTVIMPADYGYIRRTVGADGEGVDCYVGPNPESSRVWVIEQLKLDGTPDEDKVMLGYSSMRAALSDYAAGFTDGRALERIGSVRTMKMETFKTWLSERGTNAPAA